jgi:hypothetical protein
VNPADLDAVWRAVDAPAASGGLAGKPAPGLDPRLGVLLAIDSQQLRHILIPADGAAEQPAKAATKGLEVTVDELQADDRPPRRYVDVACRDATMHANFTAIAAEIVEELTAGLGDSQRTLERILARWRWFWDTPPAGLTETEAVGLFGELWFLEFWLDPIDVAVLRAWTGPRRDRHDFKWPAASVEVKATRARSDGSASHRISTLDQLEDPAQGQLYLFSLRVSPDPIAAHSLNASIERIRRTLSAHAELLHEFDERVATLGYSPAQRERYDTPFRVVAEELYRVDAEFPRLTRNSFIDGAVPTGVGGIGYSLDLAACAPWRVATAPGAEAHRLRQGLSAETHIQSHSSNESSKMSS